MEGRWLTAMISSRGRAYGMLDGRPTNTCMIGLRFHARGVRPPFGPSDATADADHGHRSGDRAASDADEAGGSGRRALEGPARLGRIVGPLVALAVHQSLAGVATPPTGARATAAVIMLPIGVSNPALVAARLDEEGSGGC